MHLPDATALSNSSTYNTPTTTDHNRHYHYLLAVTTWQQQGITHSVSGSVSAVPSDNQSHYLNSHFEPIRDENLFWRCDQNWDLPFVISPNATVTYQLKNGSRCTFSVLSHSNLFHLIENTSMVVETHLEYFSEDVGPLRDPLLSGLRNFDIAERDFSAL